MFQVIAEIAFFCPIRQQMRRIVTSPSQFASVYYINKWHVLLMLLRISLIETKSLSSQESKRNYLRKGCANTAPIVPFGKLSAILFVDGGFSAFTLVDGNQLSDFVFRNTFFLQHRLEFLFSLLFSAHLQCKNSSKQQCAAERGPSLNKNLATHR